MAQCDRYGYLLHGDKPMTDIQLARMVGSDESEVKPLRVELLSARVPSLDGEAWYSRRLVRDHELREKLSCAGKKGGNPILKQLTQEPKNPRTHGSTPPLDTPLIQPLNLSTNPPSLEDCIKAASAIGMKREDIEACYHHYNGQGWKKASGIPLTNLSSVLARWKANASNFSKPNDADASKTNKTPPWRRLELLKGMVSQFTARNPSPERWTAEQREEVKRNRAEIARLEKEMVHS